MKKIGDITNTADNNGEFTDGNVSAGTPPTQLMAAWFNSVQREILNVLFKAGILQSEIKEDQLAEAIGKMIDSANYLPTGYSYSKTESDSKYQLNGDYATNEVLTDELNKKLDKKGGEIEGFIVVKGSVTADDRVVQSRGANGNVVQLDASDSAGAKLRSLKSGGSYSNHYLPLSSGTIMQVGDYGFGGVAPLVTNNNLTKIDVTTLFRQDGGSGNNIFNSHGVGISVTYNPSIRMGFFIKGNGELRTYISRNDTEDGALKVSNVYSEANTVTDRNGNLKVFGVSDALSDFPVGSPIPWPQAAAPAGFLICNGQTFNKTTYPLLAVAYPSGKLPDLRAEFIRGLDAERNIDSGRAVLSAQSDAIRNITGEFAMNGEGNMPDNKSGWATGAFKKNLTGLKSHTEQSLGGISYTFDASRVVPTANENRPRNIAFLYIVRAA